MISPLEIETIEGYERAVEAARFTPEQFSNPLHKAMAEMVLLQYMVTNYGEGHPFADQVLGDDIIRALPTKVVMPWQSDNGVFGFEEGSCVLDYHAMKPSTGTLTPELATTGYEKLVDDIGENKEGYTYVAGISFALIARFGWSQHRLKSDVITLPNEIMSFKVRNWKRITGNDKDKYFQEAYVIGLPIDEFLERPWKNIKGRG